MRLPFPVRKVLGRMLAGIPVRIRSGPNAGCRWSLAAAGRHWAGRFEASRIDAILALIRPGDCVWDIGAHHGYVSLAASRSVGSDGHVYSLEPSKYNYAYLRRHVEWNGRENITPLNLGVGATPGRVRFGGSGSSQRFRIGEGSELVEVTSIQRMMNSDFRLPDVVKIDVEGAEGPILATGARHLPSTAVTIISIHSLENYDLCVSALRSAGFSIHLSEGVRMMKERGTWGGDPDIIAVGSERGDLSSVVGRLRGFAPAMGSPDP